MGVTLLGKEAILGAKDAHQEIVHVEEWGGSVCIRAMSGAERDDFRAAIEGTDTSLVGKFEAPLLALTLVDETGQTPFYYRRCGSASRQIRQGAGQTDPDRPACERHV